MSTGGRQIRRAALQVVALFVVSRLLGLLREVVIGAAFGTSAEYDAYLAAITIPDILFTLIAGGALGSAFIPTFTGYLARGDAAGAWRLASGVVNLLVLVLLGATALAWLGAPLLVSTVLVPGFSPSQQALTASLMRVMLLAPLCFGVSGVVMGILNARQHFILPALTPSFLNLALIGAAWLAAPRLGVRALAWGYLAGALLHLLVQLPGLYWVGARYNLRLNVRDPGIRQVLKLMAPRVLGLAAVQLNFVVNKNIASWFGAGAVSALNYAWLLMLLPQGVFAQAVATAAFPTFADQVARGKRDELRHSLVSTLRTVFFLCIPAAVGLLVLGRPFVAALFERGAFGAASTEAVAWALSLYALGLVGHAGIEIVARGFYALHDTWTPVWVGGAAMGVNVVASLALSAVFARAGLPPHGGLALANSLAALLEMAWLLVRIRSRIGGLEGRALLRSTAQSGLAAGVMAAVLVTCQLLLPSVPPVLLAAGGIVLGAAVYLLVAYLLRAEELALVRRLFLKRLQRG